MGADVRRVAIVLAAALGLLAVPLAAPGAVAYACACGAYSPADGGDASVPHETALVRTSGRGVEDVYLSLTVDSDVRAGALLFPVPDARAEVSAGPHGLFPALDRITAPRPSAGSGGGNGAAPGGGVTVQKRQRVGPLDVATLTTRDPAALARWLPAHGFAAKPSLARSARAYTDRGWAFVAVRLRADGSTPLHGALDPLRIRFRSRDVVYPMRLSATAAEPAAVTVYTLTPRPWRLTSRTPGMAPGYRGHVHLEGELAPLTADGTTYLSRWDGTLAPRTITDDFHFRDDPTEIIDDSPLNAIPPFRGDGPGTGRVVAAAVLSGIALGVAVLITLSLRRSRRRS